MKLLSINASNTKIKKTQEKELVKTRLASLSLYPDNIICPGSIAAKCQDGCLVSAGRGRFDNVANARRAKTEFWHNDQAGFLAQLRKELANFDKLCKRQGVRGVVRLNTTDIVRDLRAGDSFGESALYVDSSIDSKPRRSATVIAKIESTVLSISGREFELLTSFISNLTSPVLENIHEFRTILRGARDKSIVLGALVDSQFEHVASVMRMEQFSKEQVVLNQGDLIAADSCFYIVTSGAVRVIKDGRTVFRMSAGNVFGEIGVLTGLPRTARGRSHGFTVRYSDDFDGWDTLDGKPC